MSELIYPSQEQEQSGLELVVQKCSTNLPQESCNSNLSNRTKAFTLYTADVTGMHDNCLYPNTVEVVDTSTLKEATSRDYVCAAFKNHYRSVENFKKADCIGGDCDNDHSDNPDDWVTPEDVRKAFPDVTLAIHYSRHHLKPKSGKTARPKFHCVLLTEFHTDPQEHKRLKKLAHKVFPFFDTNAMDAARFFFGTKDAKVEFYPGTKTLTESIQDDAPDETRKRVIQEGNRNATLSRFAGRILKRYGDCETALSAFQDEAARCDPPMEEEELSVIWKSAQAFFKRIKEQEDYIAPGEYNAQDFIYMPDDCTDVGQARTLGVFFSDELRYSPATDYIRYNGVYWQETKPGAQAVAHALTDLQLEEARRAIEERALAYKATGAADLIAKNPKKKAMTLLNDEQLAAYDLHTEAVNYRSFVLQRRESKYITATLHEARPVLEIDPALLDKDWHLLCTPDATYNLRKGLAGARLHDPEDYITRATSVSPGTKGREIWLDALNVFFGHEVGLAKYVQRVAGVACAGQVFWEAMIIAYGDGRNGKSTFWNTLARVLGSYSGNISADSLTVGCRRNVKPELAEARGKRLLIAAELEEGTRLNTSTVKQLTSTDNVFAEKKYKDPFSYTPSHTLVLYTNHLPKVGALDTGIWRRLVVIPFTAKIEGTGDIKNYADYLVQNAGEAIMAWMIEGAQESIDLGFKIPEPACVRDAIKAYREQSDWLGHFLNERCEIGKDLQVKSGDFYNAYRAHCIETNEYIRSTSDFYTAIEAEGFIRRRTNAGSIVQGLMLRATEFQADEFPDFLN